MIPRNHAYDDYMGIGRCPRLKFIARPALNDDDARPGREWYITAIPLYSFTVNDNLSGVHYTLRLERHDEDWNPLSQVLFSEDEAKALVALLNGLEVAPTHEDRVAMEKRLEEAYPMSDLGTKFTITIKDAAEEAVKEKHSKKKSRKK